MKNTVQEARESWQNLETELQTAKQKQKIAREGREKAVADLAECKQACTVAEAHIEEVIDSVAAGAATQDDVRAARATVRSLHSEIEDLGAVLKAHGPVEMRLAAEANDLRNRLTLERKLFWSTVAEELEEKLRKTASDLVHQAAAARELSGVYLFSGAGDYLAKTFFGGSAPHLDGEKAKLLEKYIGN